MIIQWGSGGVGGGGGDGSVNPQAAIPPDGAYGMGGGQPLETQTNTMMKAQATPEPFLEAAPAATEAAIPKVIAPNTGATSQAPDTTKQPVMEQPTDIPSVEDNNPTEGAVAQEKQLPSQEQGPVKILGIAPTQERGLIQYTPPVIENIQAPNTPVIFLPFIQAGLIILALTAGILALLLSKKT